ncbi:hypothetical protein CTAM01_04505 [Colletotrichum tamarilloi]|uniref:Uncharacterized protein n=1 Tax=Colletotrichum tamarilloi TaxID=1209934 RepID=A0ABQ9RIN7_9PEZI|nr:uncharacterized protein CTAM01_04505 [Colletotrichum tamarilloi]KAK1504275.1 hypothetical protein CTAM01_04505 [Colletotrichum tamarilloi]
MPLCPSRWRLSRLAAGWLECYGQEVWKPCGCCERDAVTRCSALPLGSGIQRRPWQASQRMRGRGPTWELAHVLVQRQALSVHLNQQEWNSFSPKDGLQDIKCKSNKSVTRSAPLYCRILKLCTPRDADADADAVGNPNLEAHVVGRGYRIGRIRGGFFRRRRATILARSADQSGQRRHGCRDKPAPTATEKGGISQASPQLFNMMLHAVWKARPAKRQAQKAFRASDIERRQRKIFWHIAAYSVCPRRPFLRRFHFGRDRAPGCRLDAGTEEGHRWCVRCAYVWWVVDIAGWEAAHSMTKKNSWAHGCCSRFCPILRPCLETVQ